jgi:transcriptional regulator with XRE-family HTH domain
MTRTHIETSSLRAAREWRGISLAEAARMSGLTMTQAEALEDGETGEFATTDEMIAAAVLYGSCLGIGRDEATALLDRTDASVTHTPTPAAFSMAVRDRSAAIRERSDEDLQLEPLTFDLPSGPMPVVAAEQTGNIEIPGPVTGSPFEPTGVTGELPVVPSGAFDAAQSGPQLSDNPTVRAAMQLDPGWRKALEQSHSELEAWATTPAKGGGSAAVTRKLNEEMVRVLGPERAQRVTEFVDRAHTTTRRQIAELRSRMEQSEHTTLIVALGVGALLIALMIAIASALGGDEPQQPIAVTKPAKTTPATSTAAKPKQANKPKPMLRPAQLQVEILNAGSRAGYANEVADKLEGLGYRITDVGNSETDYKSAVILYSEGLNREALRLSKQIGVTTIDVLPETKGQNRITAIVV